MQLDPDHCYEAIKARDARFDGVFFVGVSTTGVYCRPVCTVRTPGRDRCTFYANAALAEAAGYRPCLRCRPELAPGSAPMDSSRRIANLAVARIESGALGESDLGTLADEFSLSERQLRRVIEQEYGVAPVALAQTRRLLMAKHLLTDTRLRMADVAFASGFQSVRRFNHLFRSRYGLTPRALRRRQNADGEGITLRLGYRPPLAWAFLANFLTSRGAICTERTEQGRYVRTVRLGRQRGWIAVAPAESGQVLRVELAPSLLPVLTPLLARLRRMFDLDASPGVIEAHLGRDRRLAQLVKASPGLRIPGALDGFEIALRAVLGQQISVRAATTVFGRFAQFFGEAVETPYAGLDRTAPGAEALADARTQQIIDRGVTRQRAASIRALARAVADGRIMLEPTVQPDTTTAALAELPGIGPWTIQYISMRALSNPDAFPASDLGLLKALRVSKPAQLSALAEQWRPWRAYAALHLWRSYSGG